MLDSTDLEHTRLKRYALAEQSLKTALRHSACTEPEPRELQIRTLKQATQMLTTRAGDAQQRIETLRGRLLDRQLDPMVYSTLQQERWMEEKRRLAIQDEMAVLQRQLDSLTVGGSTRPAVSVTPDERRRINLARFLVSSSPTQLRTSCSSKRMTVQDPPSRRLRPLSLTSKRPHSVDNHAGRSPTAEFAPIVEEQSPPRATLRPSVSTKSSPALRSPSPSMTSTSNQSSPYTPSTDFSPKATWFTLDDGRDGTAVIYRDHVHRAIQDSNSKLLLKDLHVDMPDYARTLIDEFDEFIAPPDLPFSSPNPSSSNTSPSPKPSPPPFTPSLPSSPSTGQPAPESPRVDPTRSRLHRKLSQRSSLFSISEAISSRISFVGDHIHSPFSPKPSMSSLKSAQPSSHPTGGLETVGEVDGAEADRAPGSPSQPRLSFATRMKRRVLDRNGK